MVEAANRQRYGLIGDSQLKPTIRLFEESINRHKLEPRDRPNDRTMDGPELKPMGEPTDGLKDRSELGPISEPKSESMFKPTTEPEH